MADLSTMIRQILARHQRMKTDRSNWESVWRELSDYFQPLKSRFLCDDNAAKKEARNTKLIDNTGLLASRILASGMMAGITSPARPWFKFELEDDDLNDDHSAQIWLEDTTKRCLAAMSRSNVYQALNSTYMDLGVFATHCFLLLEDHDDDIRALPIPIGSYSLACDYRGRVNTMYREYTMTVAQVVEEFGIENVSSRVKEAHKRGGESLNENVSIIHAIEPNPDYDPDKRSNNRLPFRSVYITKEGGHNPDEAILRISGFHENPIIAPRWFVQANEVYGTGPGWDARGDCKSLQLMQKDKHKAVSKLIDPPLNVPNGINRNGRVSLNPGAVNYYDEMTAANGGKGIHPIYQVQFDISAVLADIEDSRARINQAFYVDLFRMMMNDDRSNITAREVQERHEERMLMLGPVLESVQKDLQQPLLDRVFGILWRKGKLMDLPDSMKDMPDAGIHIEYTSVLAQAQRMVGTQAIERFLSFTGNMLQAFPTVGDLIDTDKAVREYGEDMGVSQTILRSDEDVESIRQQRQEQQNQEQQMQQFQQVAEGAQLLSQTDMGNNTNALQQLTGGA